MKRYRLALSSRFKWAPVRDCTASCAGVPPSAVLTRSPTSPRARSLATAPLPGSILSVLRVWPPFGIASGSARFSPLRDLLGGAYWTMGSGGSTRLSLCQSTHPSCWLTWTVTALYSRATAFQAPSPDLDRPWPQRPRRGRDRRTTRGGTMSAVVTPAQSAREELSGFKGRLIGPDDAEYDEARPVYNAMIDRRPALLARCADADDVAAVVRFAAEHDLLLAIRGGGHNGAGLGTCDDGVVIDLSPLKSVEVDPEARTVRVGGGCTWGEVDAATNEHGLATPSGIISTTGVGGLTLGGGLGNLARTCGLTIDNLLEAEVVLASGERVRASADENPDLYWAIRGGGGNFGVVTSFLFRLHEVGTVIGGPTFWPVEASAEVLSVYREFLPAAPRELNGFFAFHTVPPAPPFPEEIHLRKVCGVVWCHVGGEEEAARAMAPLLEAVPEPLLHGVQPMPHPALQSAFDDLYPPGDQWYWRGGFVHEIPPEAAEMHGPFGAEMPAIKAT